MNSLICPRGSLAEVLASFFLLLASQFGQAQATYTTLHSFTGGADGASPQVSLTQGTDGDFYGTTEFDGANGNGGTVFRITPSGTLTTLYSFCAQDGCTDGTNPGGTLVQGLGGNFYGTTAGGGGYTHGTVFRITPSGTLTTLYSFCAQDGCTDGSAPIAGLVLGTDGNFYGTTLYGGPNNSGTVFKISPAGALTPLHSFNGADGAQPFGRLIQTTDGNFYGTTSAGGANNFCTNGCGTVFKINPNGTLTTLYSFCSETTCLDGAEPVAGLVQATDGNFYGTTIAYGANGVGGTVFKINPNGTLTTLYSFCSEMNCADGGGGEALVQGADGRFYGTTYAGGFNNFGTIFKITPSGTLTTLHTFNGADGSTPSAGLVQTTNGLFYGTTAFGGKNDAGTVFRLAVVAAAVYAVSESKREETIDLEK